MFFHPNRRTTVAKHQRENRGKLAKTPKTPAKTEPQQQGNQNSPPQQSSSNKKTKVRAGAKRSISRKNHQQPQEQITATGLSRGKGGAPLQHTHKGATRAK